MLKLHSDPSYVDMIDFVKQTEDWRRWVEGILVPKPLNPIKASLSYYSTISHEKLDDPLGDLAKSLPLFTFSKREEIFIIHIALANHIVMNNCWQTEELMKNLREVNRQGSDASKGPDEEYVKKLKVAETVLDNLKSDDYTFDLTILEEEYESYRMYHSYSESCMSLDKYKETYIQKLHYLLQDIIAMELELYRS